MDGLATPVRYVLERNARERPDEQFVQFENGDTWTRVQGLQAAHAAARVLRAAGVRRGDRVAVFLPNGEDFLRAWWGICFLGAVIVPVNLALRGAVLENLIALGQPTAVVLPESADDQFASAPSGAAVRHVRPADLRAPLPGPADPLELDGELQVWDPHMMLLTSGTSGPSKLVELSYQASHVGGTWLLRDWGATGEDVFLVDLPLFHAAALWQVTQALDVGVRLAIRSQPDLRNYWDVARATGATIGYLLSSMVPYLLAQPERPEDKQHKLRLMVAAPLPADIGSFAARFGIAAILTGYGSTEVPGCTTTAPGRELKPGSCGHVRAGFEVRIVDDHDFEVPVGTVGELVVRPDQPWSILTCYVDNPAAQATAFRNGWFHTGDLMRIDDDGYFFFVDRKKDAVRRRGENVSAFEVEGAANAFAGVQESACVAHPSADIDDDVKVWVLPRPGAVIDPEKLFLHLVDQLPYFMVPQYVEVADDLPRTSTAKVQKFLLREWGNSDRTWDRSAAGYKLSRRGLERNGG